MKQFLQEQIIVGSSPEANLRLEGPGISEFHCVIELRPQGFFVGDLGSATGTLLQGQLVMDAPVSSGQKIGLGEFEVHFFVGVPKPVSVAAEVHPKEPPTQIPKAESQPVQEVVSPKTPLSSSKKKSAVVSVPTSSSGAVSKHSTALASRAHRGTYAPPSSVQDLRTYLKPSTGPVLEVVISWQERILNSLHFSKPELITLGSQASSHIQVPSSLVPTQIGFIDLRSAPKLFVPDFADIELVQSGRTLSRVELEKNARLQPGSSGGHFIEIKSGEMLHLNFGDSGWNFWIRFVAQAPLVPSASSSLSSAEISTLLLTLGAVLLLSLLVSMTAPIETSDPEAPAPLRQAQFVYQKKPVVIQQGNPQDEIGARPTPTRVEMKDQKTEAPKAQQASPQPDSSQAAQAAEVRPNQTKNKTKTNQVTSTKRGGSVKLAEKEAANSRTRDLSKSGVMGAFGGSGVRKQLDRAYSGAGDLLGMADRASGSSGPAANRSGEDIGSKLRSTGEGGNGQAAEGLADIKTKGRSSGQSTYGVLGSGGKGSVSIVSSGEGAGFTGGLDKAGIRRTVQSMLGEIRACYEKGLRLSSALEGRVLINFEIDDRGQVTSSRVASSNIPNDEVGNCIANRIRVKRFPPSPKGVIGAVDYPFIFSPQN